MTCWRRRDRERLTKCQNSWINLNETRTYGRLAISYGRLAISFGEPSSYNNSIGPIFYQL